MKKLAFYLGMMVVSMGIFTTNVMAQDTYEAGEAITYDLPAMRILDLEGTAPSLTLVAPDEAGTAIADATSNSSWINYTSIIESLATNKVTVALTGTVPAGTTLKVVAAAQAGTGDGTFGSPTEAVTLSTTPADLITAIGSCYTGTGNTNGHQLTYTWSVDDADYASVVAASGTDITATYTIIATL
jgi:hypothetical protein